MQTISLYATAVTSYIVAAFAIFFDTAVAHGGAAVSFLGFVLLIARLVQEVPKAYKVLFKKDTADE